MGEKPDFQRDFVACGTCGARFHPSLCPDGEYYCSSHCAWVGVKAERERLRVALTPSPETKAAYTGEFSYRAEQFDEDGNSQVVTHYVPWTTIKEIMAAIRKRAAWSPKATTPEGSENG